MKLTTRTGPAQVGTRNGSPGEWREGTEITGALLAAARRLVNLKTAKALGLTIPPSVLVRTDHIIE